MFHLNPFVVVTRPKPQGEILCQKIQEKGWRTIFFPTIEFISLDFSHQLPWLTECDWLIFISPQAVYQTHQRLAPLLSQQHIAAVGAGTARALQESGLPVDAYPTEEWNSEGLLALVELQQVQGKKIVILKGRGGRELLIDQLAARGATVIPIDVYQRVLPKYDNPLEWLHKQPISVIVCTSNEGLENLTSLCKAAWQRLRTIPILVVSSRMQARAQELGFDQVVVAKNASHDAILEAIEKGSYMSKSSSQRVENASDKKPKFAWKTAGIVFSVIAVVILIGSFIAANVYYLKLIQNTKNLNAARSTELRAQQAALMQSIEHLKTATQQQEQSLNALRQTQASENREEWRLLQAAFLVKLANNKLQFEDNVSQAITLLQNADAEIHGLNQEKLLVVRKALANDIAQLQSAPQVDITGIYLRLAALNEQVDHLPLINNRPDQPAVSAVSEEKLPWWKSGLQQSWQALQKIVVIRYHQHGVPPLVTPDQKEFVYQNLHAVMEKSMWALLHKNADIYQASLQQAITWVKQYCLADSSVTQNVLNQLSDLQKLTIHPELPKLTESLDALAQNMK